MVDRRAARASVNPEICGCLVFMTPLPKEKSAEPYRFRSTSIRANSRNSRIRRFRCDLPIQAHGRQVRTDDVQIPNAGCLIAFTNGQARSIRVERKTGSFLADRKSVV